eukprot:1176515-Prorocentrum_minimum.AAC.4
MVVMEIPPRRQLRRSSGAFTSDHQKRKKLKRMVTNGVSPCFRHLRVGDVTSALINPAIRQGFIV